MRLHAVVADAATARWAAANGATVVQVRLKGVGTAERIRVGAELAPLQTMLVINDDVAAAAALAADAVHLGQHDGGSDQARAAGVAFGRSVASAAEARAAEAEGALYLGAGPVWSTPTKPDAGEAIGLEGLTEICAAVSLPVVAIGGVDSGNAATCIAGGAAGVAVVRGIAEIRRLREVVDAALGDAEMRA